MKKLAKVLVCIMISPVMLLVIVLGLGGVLTAIVWLYANDWDAGGSEYVVAVCGECMYLLALILLCECYIIPLL